MPSWANSGSRDLHLDLDLHQAPAGPAGCRRGCAARAVRYGRLPPGARLPSTRALAADLGMARGTVADAYDQLVIEGWLAARHGAGTAVAWNAAPSGAGPPRRTRAPTTRRRRMTSARAVPTSPRSPAANGRRPAPACAARAPPRRPALRRPTRAGGDADRDRRLRGAGARCAAPGADSMITSGFTGDTPSSSWAAFGDSAPDGRGGIRAVHLPRCASRATAGSRRCPIGLDAEGVRRRRARPSGRRRRRCSPRRTSTRIGIPLRAVAAHRGDRVGAQRPTGTWSTTTTTASSATTASRSARCKRWTPTASSTRIRQQEPVAGAAAGLDGAADRLVERRHQRRRRISSSTSTASPS